MSYSCCSIQRAVQRGCVEAPSCRARHIHSLVPKQQRVRLLYLVQCVRRLRCTRHQRILNRRTPTTTSALASLISALASLISHHHRDTCAQAPLEGGGTRHSGSWSESLAPAPHHSHDTPPSSTARARTVPSQKAVWQPLLRPREHRCHRRTVYPTSSDMLRHQSQQQRARLRRQGLCR